MDLNQTQLQRVFSYIDTDLSEDISEKIFAKLGHECFLKSIEWVNSIGQNIEKVIDDVNVKNLSPYWEKLEYGKDKNELILTGRVVDKCACALASSEQPQEGLCKYCCKRFQEDTFSVFLGKPVKVTITESKMMGGNRCSTRIEIPE